MLFKIRLSLVFVLLIVQSITAQRTHPVLFKSGVYVPQESTGLEFSTDELQQGYAYRLLVFQSILNEDAKRELQLHGIELLKYLPETTFFARIQPNVNLLNLHQISHISRIRKEFKLSAELASENYPHWALFGDREVELKAAYFDGASENMIRSFLETFGAKVLSSHQGNVLRFRIPIEQLENVFAFDAFYYFECIPPPEEPENLEGRTNHRSNALFTEYANGLQFDGTGVTVMLQDDGYIGDHIDYKGRIDQSSCDGCSLSDIFNHGDHVAGTLMGAGNLNPKYRGMASGANLLVFDSNDSNYDSIPNLYANQGVTITSKSYGVGCNGGYDLLASQLDEQCFQFPSLLHVFSAGNSGNFNCGYGAGIGWGNITGGHKSGKNVIAVGNLTTDDTLNVSSSRGPTPDGRIKPDICAVGTDVVSTISDYTYSSKTGTSMACPGVAGTIAQLYHAYKELNSGINPPNGLIKGTLLNTADDLGNPGPDFKHGWGRVNARNAYELIANNNYITDTISQSETDVHTLTIPSGVKRLKVMVYWTDYPATVNASLDLVNNLNMQVVDPGLVPFDPWVLNPFPDPVTLDLDPIRTIDNLNNVEQVTIDDPLAGQYSININGFSVPQGPQVYHILYEFELDDVVLTYPIGGEGFEPGANERIRWDAYAGTTDFNLDYSLDNGTTWIPISSVNSGERSYVWTVPSVLTGQAKVRVTRGVQSDENDVVFSIVDVPENLGFGWSCPDSINFTWDTVPGATSYTVYQLGTSYMDSISTTTATNYSFQIPASDENWYSVRALGANGARSERAVAIRKLPGQFGCPWAPPFSEISVACDSVSSTACVQALNQSVNVDGNSSYQWYFPNGIPATSTDENPVVCFSNSGYQHAALVVTNSAGSDSSFFSNFVFIQGAKELPYHEGFENINTFNGQEDWSVKNPNINNTFVVTNTTALSGSRCAQLENYDQLTGSIDELISGPINLSTLDPNNEQMTLSFRYSYRKRTDNSVDQLSIYIKNSCDNDWVLHTTLTADDLAASNSNYNIPWVPESSNDWITYHIPNIHPLFFTNDFRFKFHYENGGGNNLYLDDINLYAGNPSNDVVSGLTESSESYSFMVYPNPTDEQLTIQYELNSPSTIDLQLFDIQGKTVAHMRSKGSSGFNTALLNTHSLETGVYFLSLELNNKRYMKKVIVRH